TGRDRSRLDGAVASIGRGCVGFVADAGDDTAMASALEAAARPSGGLDVLFVNAGHYVPSALGQTTREEFEGQMRVVSNIFMTVQLALSHLRDRSSIVLMGSVYATMGPPGAAPML